MRERLGRALPKKLLSPLVLASLYVGTFGPLVTASIAVADLRSQVDRQNVTCPDPEQLPSSTQRLDALVILGSGTVGDSPDSFGKVRIKAALVAAQRQVRNFGTTPMLIHSGATEGVASTSMPEMVLQFAKMQPEWRDLSQRPDFKIIFEGDSEDTATNMKNSVKIVQEQGFESVGVVSNGQHALSAAIMGRARGINTTPVVAEAELRAEGCNSSRFECGFEGDGIRRIESVRQFWLSYDPQGELLRRIKNQGLQTKEVKKAVAGIDAQVLNDPTKLGSTVEKLSSGTIC